MYKTGCIIALAICCVVILSTGLLLVMILVSETAAPIEPAPSIIVATPLSLVPIVESPSLTPTATTSPTFTPTDNSAASEPPAATDTPPSAVAPTAPPSPTGKPVIVHVPVDIEIKTFLPALLNAPTPTAQEAYRRSLAAWLLSAKQWAADLKSVFDQGLTISSPQWLAEFDHMEQGLNELVVLLSELHPPDGYVNAHQMLLVSMDACQDAIQHYHDGKIGFGDLSITTCALGFELAASKIQFDP